MVQKNKTMAIVGVNACQQLAEPTVVNVCDNFAKLQWCNPLWPRDPI